MASSMSPLCSHVRSRLLWNVLNTSWLAKPEQVERPRPVVGDERARGGEVLAAHDLGRLGGPVLVAGVAGPHPLEGPLEVAQLLAGIAGLAQLVAAGVLQRRDAVAQGRIGVLAQPAGRFHDVRVRVVDDEPRRVVPHRPIMPPPTAGSAITNPPEGFAARPLSCPFQ